MPARIIPERVSGCLRILHILILFVGLKVNAHTTELKYIENQIGRVCKVEKCQSCKSWVSFLQELENEGFLEKSNKIVELKVLSYKKCSNKSSNIADFKIEVLEFASGYESVFETKIDSLRNYNLYNPDISAPFAVLSASIFDKPPLILLFKKPYLFVIRALETSDGKLLYELEKELSENYEFDVW